MIRSVTANAMARCPISIAMSYAQSFLRLAEAGGEAATVVAGPLRRRVSMTFGLATDTTQPGRMHEELRLGWTARTAWLPDFTGTLQFRIGSVDSTMLILNGRYRPPGGIAGLLFDELVGQRIAHATARDFVARIAHELELREADWQRRFELSASGSP